MAGMTTNTIPTWTVGDRLRKAREAAGYTRPEFAVPVELRAAMAGRRYAV